MRYKDITLLLLSSLLLQLLGCSETERASKGPLMPQGPMNGIEWRLNEDR